MTTANSEVLEAEAAIRLLAEELGRASSHAQQAEAAERALLQARTALEEASVTCNKAGADLKDHASAATSEIRATYESATRNLIESVEQLETLRAVVANAALKVDSQSEAIQSVVREHSATATREIASFGAKVASELGEVRAEVSNKLGEVSPSLKRFAKLVTDDAEQMRSEVHSLRTLVAWGTAVTVFLLLALLGAMIYVGSSSPR